MKKLLYFNKCLLLTIFFIIYVPGVIKVFTSCCQLQTVYLRRCINVSDTAIITLTENCRHLEHLNLCGCINITDTSLHVLAKNCRFLQSLNISKTKVRQWLICIKNSSLIFETLVRNSTRI